MLRWLYTLLGKKPKTHIYPQQAGEDWYWIGLGVSDVSLIRWDSSEINYKLTHEQRLKNVREYQGALRGPWEHWPEPWRSAYREGHNL